MGLKEIVLATALVAGCMSSAFAAPQAPQAAPPPPPPSGLAALFSANASARVE